ncbi:MAG: glycosyltransferase [Actinomycetota bacterium]
MIQGPESLLAIHGHELAKRNSRRDQKLLNRSLLFGRKNLDILIINSKHGTDLPLLAEGLSYVVFDPLTRPAIWCIRFWVLRLLFVHAVPKDSRGLVAAVRTLRPKAVLSSDGYRNVCDVDDHLKPSQVYIVQHGTFIDQRSSVVKRDKEVPDRASSVTLFSISEYDVENYRRWGVRPRRIIPVGTIRNSVYLTKSVTRGDQALDAHDICLIEKGIILNPDTDLKRARLAIWDAFFADFSSYCTERRPRVVIALTAGCEAEGGIEWIREHFTYDFTSVSVGKDRFATYKAIDSAELSIGQASTTLSEALSRRRKILNINYSPYTFWNVPGDGISRLQEPTSLELHRRIDEIREMDWFTYWSRVPEELREFTVDKPEEAISRIRSTIVGDLYPERNC